MSLIDDVDSLFERRYDTSSSTTTTELLVEELTPNTQYSIRIASVNAAGRSEFGEETLLKTLADGLLF